MLISAAAPTKVTTVELTRVSVTPPPTPAPSAGVLQVPADTVRVTVILPLSTSPKVVPDRLTLLSVSSVTVTSEGKLETLGGKLVAKFKVVLLVIPV